MDRTELYSAELVDGSIGFVISSPDHDNEVRWTITRLAMIGGLNIDPQAVVQIYARQATNAYKLIKHEVQ